MSCITKLLEIKGDKDILPIHEQCVIEGGGNYKGFEFLITFTSHGTRCGYVAIPDGFGGSLSSIYCHGGVTFEGRDHGAKDLLPIPCNDTWIGFDCAHYGDSNDLELAKKYFGGGRRFDILMEIHKDVEALEVTDPFFSHKTYEFVEKECQYIIDQLVEQQDAA